jgi:hypothetical protein
MDAQVLSTVLAPIPGTYAPGLSDVQERSIHDEQVQYARERAWEKAMAHPHCFTCGRGLSQKHRPAPEERLILAIFNKPAGVCAECAQRLLATIPKVGQGIGPAPYDPERIQETH